MPSQIVADAVLMKLAADLDGLRTDLRRATGLVDKSSSTMERRLLTMSAKFRTIGKSMVGTGRSMATSLTLPIVGVGVVMAKSAATFELEMNRVQAITDATSQEFNQLEAEAKRLGATTQFTAGQTADAMGFLAQAGFDVSEIMGTVGASLNLASAAQIDLASSADIMSNVMAGYGLETSKSGHATDVLTKAFTSANTDLTQLSEAFKIGAPLARAAGMAFEETTAALALMGNAGVQGTLAGTALKNAMNQIHSPTKEASKMLNEFGINLFDASGKMKPFVDIIELMEPHLNNVTALTEIFGLRGLTAITTLGVTGSAKLRELITELENAGSTADRLARVQMRGLTGAMRRLKAAGEAVSIAFGASGVLKWLGETADSITEWLREFAKTEPETLKFIAAIAGVTAILAPLVIGLGFATIAVGALSTAMITLFSNPWFLGAALAINLIVIAYQLLNPVVDEYLGLNELEIKSLRDLEEIRKRQTLAVGEEKSALKTLADTMEKLTLARLRDRKTMLETQIAQERGRGSVIGQGRGFAGQSAARAREAGLAAELANVQSLIDEINATPIELVPVTTRAALFDYVKTWEELNNEINETRLSAEELEAAMKRGERIFDATRTPLEAYNLALAELKELFNAGAISANTQGRAIKQLDKELADSLEALAAKSADIAGIMETVWEGAGKQIQLFSRNGRFELSRLGDWATNIASQIANSFIQLGIAKLLMSAGAGDFAKTLFGDIAGGGFAGGGRVKAGVPITVGERGREQFVPDTSGVIMNAHNTRGAQGQTVVVKQSLHFDTVVQPDMYAAIQAARPILREDAKMATLKALRG